MIYGASDLHICQYVWKSRKDIKGDSYTALQNLAKFIIEDPRDADENKHVILAGDIFDAKRVEDETLDQFRIFMDSLLTQGIKVYFVPGNHDAGLIGLPAVFGAINISGELVDMDGHLVYGVPWMPRQQLYDAIQGAPECDLLVTHTMFQHLVGFESASAFTLEDVPEQVKNVLVGDIHVTNITPLRGKGFVISPGALHPCNLSQGGHHGYWCWDSEDNWSFQEIPSRQIYRFSISNEQEFLDVAKRVADIVAEKLPMTPIVEIRYSTDLTEKVDKLSSDWATGCLFFLSSSKTGKLLCTAELEEVQETFESISLADSLHSVVDPVKDRELYLFVEGLLAGDAYDRIQDKIEEMTNEAN